MLGNIYKYKVGEGKAIEQHKKFLKLWKDADPDLLETEDTKRRPAGLKNHSLPPFLCLIKQQKATSNLLNSTIAF